MEVPGAPGQHPLAHPHYQGPNLLLYPSLMAPQAGSAVAHWPPTVADLQGALEEARVHPGVLMSGFIGGMWPGPEHSWDLEIQRKGKRRRRKEKKDQ